jgi:hypothetical protein
MKRCSCFAGHVLALLAALAGGGVVRADIELFLSEYGMSSYVFDGAQRDFRPYFEGCLPAEIQPACIAHPEEPLDRVFLVWGRFILDGDPVYGTQIDVLPLRVTLSGCSTPCPGDAGAPNLMLQENVAYRHAKLNGPVSERWHRWFNDSPIGINDVLLGMFYDGVVNDTTVSGRDLVCPSDDPTDNATFLLGAFRVTSGGGLPAGCIRLSTTDVGVTVHDGLREYYPRVWVAGTVVQERWYDPNPNVHLPGDPYPFTHPAPAYLCYGCDVGAACAGDLNCDGSVTFSDIDPFVDALAGESGWAHAPCPWLRADCNGDGAVTFADIDPFVVLIGTTCR